MKSYKRLAFRVGSVGAALALSTAGLIAFTAAPPASATTITETFGSGGPTGPLELQQSESINQPTAVTQGNNLTVSVPGGTQNVPATQSGVTVNYISGLTDIIAIPPNATFVPGSIVTGNYSGTTFAPAGCVPPVGGTQAGACTGTTAVSGPVTITYCTDSVSPGCTAMLNGATIPGSSPALAWPGPTLTSYIEESTGSATFVAGTSLTLPTWSFDLTASGTGTVTTSIDEFDTNANVVLFGNNVNAGIHAYPASVVSGCVTTGGTCTTPPYQYQPIASTAINSPPAAPVLAVNNGSVGAGQCTTINVLAGSTDTGTGDHANPATVAVSTPPAFGTATVNPDGTVTYCTDTIAALGALTPPNPASDSFAVTAGDTLASPTKVSAPVTDTVTISYGECSAGSGTLNSSTAPLTAPGSCSEFQKLILPVAPGSLTLTELSPLPVDYLGSAECTGAPVPGITLNGNAQQACGRVDPVTVTNATGLDAGWTLTGQVTDFQDPNISNPAKCDTVYNNHCIPGDNLAWTPDSYVSDSIVPGDVGQVITGGAIAPFAPVAPTTSADPLIAPSKAQPTNPVVEPPVTPGLDTGGAQTLCSAASTTSGGTFICGAFLQLEVPASAAEPGAPGYVSTLTLTLS